MAKIGQGSIFNLKKTSKKYVGIWKAFVKIVFTMNEIEVRSNYVEIVEFPAEIEILLMISFFIWNNVLGMNFNFNSI